MILPTPGPVLTRLKVPAARDAAPWDNAILTFQADSPAGDALSGPGIPQRKAA